MNAINKRTERQRDKSIALRASRLCIGAALLTADDILEGKDKEEFKRIFPHCFSEIINGYADEGGLEAMEKELSDRGIEVKING